MNAAPPKKQRRLVKVADQERASARKQQQVPASSSKVPASSNKVPSNSSKVVEAKHVPASSSSSAVPAQNPKSSSSFSNAQQSSSSVQQVVGLDDKDGISPDKKALLTEVEDMVLYCLAQLRKKKSPKLEMHTTVTKTAHPDLSLEKEKAEKADILRIWPNRIEPSLLRMAKVLMSSQMALRKSAIKSRSKGLL